MICPIILFASQSHFVDFRDKSAGTAPKWRENCVLQNWTSGTLGVLLGPNIRHFIPIADFSLSKGVSQMANVGRSAQLCSYQEELELATVDTQLTILSEYFLNEEHPPNDCIKALAPLHLVPFQSSQSVCSSPSKKAALT